MKPNIKRFWLFAGAITAILFIFLFGLQSEEIIFSGKEEEEEERQSGAEKQLASWLWSRGYPDPSNINQKYIDAWRYMNGLVDPERLSGAYGGNGTSGLTIFNGNWMSIGPDNNIGGRILSIAIDPSNGNNLFVGTASGGIWKSVNGGSSWTYVRTGYPVAGVATIAYDPSNSNILYAGTGEVYRADTSNIGFNVWKARGTYGVGILKSTDRGVTWSQVFSKNVSSLFGIQQIKFDPVNSSIVYACATDGLYRSGNAGSTWTKILDKTYVADIAISSANSNLIVASVGNLQNNDKGIYKSTNGGTSWSKITAGLPATFEGFIRLDNVRTNGNLIVASVGRDAGSQNEIFRSTDFGNTWTVLSTSNHCQYQFWFAHDVAINPSNTNLIMMGGVNLYRYTVSPAATSVVRGVHSDIHDIEFDPANSNIVYVASDGGMYKSTNGGTNFTAINNGLKAVQFYASFAVSPTNPNIMVGGLQDNGVVRYNGTSWTTVAGGDGGPCIFHPTNSNIVFASNDARRLLRSTNGGSSFSEVLTSWAFAADSRTGFMAPVAISKSDPTILYSGSDNIHKSSNTGISGSWNGNSYSGATTYIEARHKTAIALAVSPLNANKLYVSTSPFAQYDNDANNIYVNN
ncbi:MAG TPA: hypothetical protein VJT83_03975, partial [Chitinophagaceae bacterium]|nr:hypothetical protein [Chitinophagaceae bacterium]